MHKLTLAILLLFFIVPFKMSAQIIGVGSRMNEVFMRTDLASGPSRLFDPWEVTYGPDGFLWITESKPYKVYRMDPNTGVKTTVLDLDNSSSFTPALFRRTYSTVSDPSPQGGMAGLAIHPDFMNPVSPKKFVYVSYVHSFDSSSVNPVGGSFFTNWIVRFTYNTSTNQLENPVAVCDTLPGSNDHNSQRMIIGKVNNVPYLFYAEGDMGAGQFNNLARINHAQDPLSYEGKILRFNLEADGDAGLLDKWIPNDNPFNTSTPLKQSAVWVTGIRNNQGFAYDSEKNILYGGSHGPFSDDEINIIERAKNYGHPRVVGYASDHNYDGAKVGPANSSLPLIYNEAKYASDTIGAAYRDPIYSFYPAPAGNPSSPASVPWSVQYIYTNQFYSGSPSGNAQDLNQFWHSEAISGMDLYTGSGIPGWKNSLLSAALKGGKIVRVNLSSDGLSVLKTAPYDTISYFSSVNRFRDIAFGPDGKTIFAVIDSSLVTSGPSATNPIISQCRGCVQKYTFLGYNTVSGTSGIPNYIPIAAGTANLCNNAGNVVINTSNANYWVPVTDASGNIVAEINANGNILGNVTTSAFVNTGAVREQPATHKLFLDRNFSIRADVQPSSPVSIRFYITNNEFNALKNATNSLGQPSGIAAITNLSVFRSGDDCGAGISNSAIAVATSNQAAFGAGGYVLQASTSSLFAFYIAGGATSGNQSPVSNAGSNVSITLPTSSVALDGSASFDPDGSIAQVYWFQPQGPVTAVIGDNFSTVTTATGLTTPGTYEFRLQVKDNNGALAYSSKFVTVNPAGIVPVPACVTNTAPANGSTIATQTTATLTWPSSPTATSYDVYLSAGTGTPTTLVTNTASLSYGATGLTAGTTYSWYIAPKNAGGTAAGCATANKTTFTTAAATGGNQVPVSNAGSNVTITLPTSSVALDGSASFDPDGSIAQVYWFQPQGPVTAVTGDNFSTVTTATGLTTAGLYEFRLQVKDNNGALAYSSKFVTVNPAVTVPVPACVTNTAPANGATITTQTTATLTWPSSATATSYDVYLSAGTGTPTTLVTNTSALSYSASGLTANTTYSWYVAPRNASGAATTCATANKTSFTTAATVSQPTVSNAGANVTITLPTSSVALDGSASTGNIVQYYWYQAQGPVTTVIGNNFSTITTATGLTTAGTYVFGLQIKDNNGVLAYSTKTVVVNPAASVPVPACVTNTAPANGSSLTTQTIATLTWQASVGATSYDVYLAAGIGTPTTLVTNTTALSYSAFGLTGGTTYSWYIAPRNASGANTACATSNKTTFTTYPSIPQPTTSNAGSNVTITLPTNSVTLDGSASTGNIVQVYWFQTEGPVQAVIGDNFSIITTATSLTIPGTYVFRLQVKNNNSGLAYSSKTVTVTPATGGNQAPVSNAGSNVTIGLPASSVSLDGSASYDPDGSIAQYYWYQSQGPVQAAIGNNFAAVTTASGLTTAGTYVFGLQVKDNNGVLAYSSKTVTVSAALAPVTTANTRVAGAAQITAARTALSKTGEGSSLPSISAVMAPNPAVSGREAKLQINSSKVGVVMVNTYSSNGAIIGTRKVNLVAGINTTNVSTIGLAQGFHVINIIGGAKPLNLKLIIQ